MIYLSKNLSYLINKKDFSLEEFSKSTNISVDFIEKFERNETIPNLEELILISEFLNYPLERLIKVDISKYEVIKKNFEFKMLVLDVDGVLTDGGMYYSQSCDELKKFNTKDGMALIKLTNAGYNAGFLSSGINETIIRKRAEMLGVKNVYVGTWKKINILEKWCAELNIDLKNIAYIGDDVNDIECMSKVGISACPADAVNKIKNIANVILKTNGGSGCVREFIDEFIMEIE